MGRLTGTLFATLFVGHGAAAAPAPEPVGGPVGADGPLVVEGYAPDRRWVALCQAREDTDGDGEISVSVGYHGDTFGDALRPYLVVGDGPGRPLDAFVDASDDGRWVALVERGRLVLWDSHADTRIDLTARGAASPARAHALFPGYGGFAPRSHRFLYLRDCPDARRRRALVLDADTGGEQVVDHGIGNLYSAWLHEGGRHVTVYTWPAGSALKLPRTSLAPGRCRGPITSYSTGGSSNVQADFVRVTGPAWTGERLALYDGRVLARDEDGRLAWDDGGRRAPALPDGVTGRLLGAGRGGAVVVAVPVSPDRSEVRWVGRDGRVIATGWTLPTPEGDATSARERIWWRWAEDRRTWLIDLETGAYTTSRFESDIEGSAGAKVFVMRRSDGWAAIVDIAAGQVTDLPVVTSPYSNRGRAGAWAFARLKDGGNVVVDVAAGRVAGYVDGPEALGLSDDGLLLTSKALPGPTVGSSLPEGPLRWVRPGALADGP